MKHKVSQSKLTDNEAFKFKKLARRATQLSFIVLALSVGISTYYLALGLTTSAIMIGCYSLCVLIILFLQLSHIIENIQPLVLTSICLLLIISSFVEGSVTGQYFYFFPIIIVIPIVVNHKESSFIELGSYFLMGIVSFGINFYVGHYIQPFEKIPENIAHRMLFTNATCAILLTLSFAVAYIYYERKYIGALIEEKNRTIKERTRFLSTMGHELRTPLNGIIGALNIFTNEQPQFNSNEYLQILKYCSNHMEQLVTDILDFNKIEAGKLNIHLVEVNLKTLLTNSALPFYNNFEKKSVQLKVKLDQQLDAVVLADDLRIIQVINNLLSNALKFTEEGYVCLNASCEDISASLIKVNFIVEDTGIGIDKIDQERIFQGFEQVYNESTRRHRGTGLGLMICLSLINLMDGTLTLTSEKGCGSTFAFSLTFIKVKKTTRKIEHAYNKSDDLAGFNILVVDDNLINMTIALKMLTSNKATCTPAYNGKEALEVLEKNSNFNIILLDLEMPVMSGHEAIFQIKKSYPNIPVVAFTASVIDGQMLAKLIENGFEDCVIKPFNPKHLFSQVKKYAIKLPGEKKSAPPI
ncbi:signal transduction histidine kinase/ActR/RegA family two-component response regulator [Mucilaginibacter sp. UYCu711]